MRAQAALLASWLRLEMIISSPGWKSKAVERLCRSWVEDIPIDIYFSYLGYYVKRIIRDVGFVYFVWTGIDEFCSGLISGIVQLGRCL